MRCNKKNIKQQMFKNYFPNNTIFKKLIQPHPITISETFLQVTTVLYRFAAITIKSYVFLLFCCDKHDAHCSSHSMPLACLKICHILMGKLNVLLQISCWHILSQTLLTGIQISNCISWVQGVVWRAENTSNFTRLRK